MLDVTKQQTQREIGMYGCTVSQLREGIGLHAITGRNPVSLVANILSDCQEIMAQGPYDGDTMANILEEQRQMLNRAKWILFNCVDDAGRG